MALVVTALALVTSTVMGSGAARGQPAENEDPNSFDIEVSAPSGPAAAPSGPRGATITITAPGCAQGGPGDTAVVFADADAVAAGAGSPQLKTVPHEFRDGLLFAAYTVAPDDALGSATILVDCVNGTSAIPFIVLAGVLAGELVDDVGGVQVRRVAGADRVATAVAVSRAVFPSATAVVVARADDPSDALVGAPLARHLGGPILLTAGNALSAGVAGELARLGASEVVLLGGADALSDRVAGQVAAALSAEGATGRGVTRVAGGDRFATAAAVAGALPASTSAYLAGVSSDDPAVGWPDALSVAPLAAATASPVLLVTRDEVPEVTREALDARAQGAQGRLGVALVGGPAVIAPAVQTAVAAQPGVVSVGRFAGGDRYATSAEVFDATARLAGADRAARWLASGVGYADALAAGPALAALGQALLLVPGDDLTASPPVVDRLRTERHTLRQVILVGGPAAITDRAPAQLREVLLQDDLDAPACAAGQLTASLGEASAFTGTSYATVELVNVSDRVCTVEGFPGVELVDAGGGALPTSTTNEDTGLGVPAVEPVPLAPAGRPSEPDRSQPGQASFMLTFRSYNDPGRGTCSGTVVEAASVRVTLPGGGGSLVAGPVRVGQATIKACEGVLAVRAVQDAV